MDGRKSKLIKKKKKKLQRKRLRFSWANGTRSAYRTKSHWKPNVHSVAILYSLGKGLNTKFTSFLCSNCFSKFFDFSISPPLSTSFLLPLPLLLNFFYFLFSFFVSYCYTRADSFFPLSFSLNISMSEFHADENVFSTCA